MSSFQPFHLLQPSPWPLVISFLGFLFTSGLVLLFSGSFSRLGKTSLLVVFLLTAWVVLCWARDILREASCLGRHSTISQEGFKLGVFLFILSECSLFLSLFWGYFHFSLVSSHSLGLVWPPSGLIPCHAFGLPLFNTILLVSRGLTVTAAHHYLVVGLWGLANYSLFATIVLGVYFLILQSVEFMCAPFSIIDSSFGSIFFMSSGAHGLHVLLGVILLTISTFRLQAGVFNFKRHLGFEFSAWYWHFVDVVWLFLFSFYYWWGSYPLSECRALNSPLFLHSRGLTPSSFTSQPRSFRAYQSFLFSTRGFPTQVRSDVKKWRSRGGLLHLVLLSALSLSLLPYLSSLTSLLTSAATLPPVYPDIRWDVPPLTYPSLRNFDPEGEDWQSNATRTPPAEARGDGRW